jgi:hypothetical protein
MQKIVERKADDAAHWQTTNDLPFDDIHSLRWHLEFRGRGANHRGLAGIPVVPTGSI